MQVICGREVQIAPLTLKQLDNFTDGVAAGNRATGRQMCIDALNNATPGSYTLDSFAESFTVPEFLELQKVVLELSGLTPPGEAAASA